MSKNASSHFYHHRFTSVFTEDGRVGLFDNKLTRRVGINTVENLEVTTPTKWLLTLKNTFNIELDFSDVELSKLLSEI